MSGKELHEYVALIESAEYDVDADELDIEHDQDEYDEVEHENEVDEGKHSDEHDDEDDVLKEDDGTFWDNFEKDSEFELEETNGMYCVKGMDTGFHYGSHVEYDVATSHLESLKNYE